MDVGATNGWRLDDVVPAAEIIERISAELPLEPVEANYRGEVAKRWRYADGAARSGHRLGHAAVLRRLHARADLGRGTALHVPLRLRGHDLRALIRGGASTRSCGRRSPAIWGKRTDRYSERRSEATVDLPKVEMSYIGGWLEHGLEPLALHRR